MFRDATGASLSYGRGGERLVVAVDEVGLARPRLVRVVGEAGERLVELQRLDQVDRRGDNGRHADRQTLQEDLLAVAEPHAILVQIAVELGEHGAFAGGDAELLLDLVAEAFEEQGRAREDTHGTIEVVCHRRGAIFLAGLRLAGETDTAGAETGGGQPFARGRRPGLVGFERVVTHQ